MSNQGKGTKRDETSPTRSEQAMMRNQASGRLVMRANYHASSILHIREAWSSSPHASRFSHSLSTFSSQANLIRQQIGMGASTIKTTRLYPEGRPAKFAKVSSQERISV